MHKLLLCLGLLVAGFGCCWGQDSGSFDIAVSNVSGLNGSSYAMGEYENDEIGLKMNGFLINSSGLAFKSKCSYFVVKSIDENVIITKIVVDTKTGVTTEPKFAVYKSDEAYDITESNKDNTSRTSLPGELLKEIVVSKTGNSTEIEVNAPYFGFVNPSKNQIIITKLTVYWERTGSAPAVCAAPKLNFNDGANVYPGQTICATSSTSDCWVDMLVKLDGVEVSEEKDIEKAEFLIPEEFVGKTLEVTVLARKEGLEDSEKVTVTYPIVEKPKTIEDILENGEKGQGMPFDFSTSYVLKSYTSKESSVEYWGKATKNNGMQINSSAGSSKSATKSGFISEKNTKKYPILEIRIVGEKDKTDKSNLLVQGSNTPGSHTGNEGDSGTSVAINPPVNATEIEGNQNGDEIIYDFSGNDFKFFSITSKAVISLSSITVVYENTDTSQPVAISLTAMPDEENVYEVGNTVAYNLSCEPAEKLQVVLPYVTATVSDSAAASVSIDVEGEQALVTINSLPEESLTLTLSLSEECANFTMEPVIVTVPVTEVPEPEKVFVEGSATFDFTSKDYAYTSWNGDNEAGYFFNRHDRIKSLEVLITDSDGNQGVQNVVIGTPEGITLAADKAYTMGVYFGKGEYDFSSITLVSSDLNDENIILDASKGDLTFDEKGSAFFTVEKEKKESSVQFDIISDPDQEINISKIMVNFWHEAVAKPQANITRLDNGDFQITLSHPDGHDIYVKKTSPNAATRVIDADNHGHQLYDNATITLSKDETLTAFAMHPDGLVSEEHTLYYNDIATGVNAIESEEGKPVYFNLQGQRVENPAEGIFIRVSANGTEKVIF